MRVKVGGRMMAKRVMGKASFAKLADRSGQIQVFLQSEPLGAAYDEFKGWDVGDIVGAEGTLFKTKTGELSVRAEKLRLLVKSLRPLPDKWHGLADQEIRYRQRYVDLIVNPDSAQVFETRTRIVKYLRDFLDAMDFLEVETPMMQPIAGGAVARPFVTHHNALDMDMYLRIAPELYLKRLRRRRLRARVRDQPQLPQRRHVDASTTPSSRCWSCTRRTPTARDFMDLVERMCQGLCDTVLGTRRVEYQGEVYRLRRSRSAASRSRTWSCTSIRASSAHACAMSTTCAATATASASRTGRATAPASCRSRSSRRRPSIACCSRRSSTRTRPKCRRSRGATTPIRSSPTASSSSSAGASSPTASRS